MQRLVSKSTQHRIAAALASSGFAILTCWTSAAAAGPGPPPTIPAVSISQVPLTVTIPAHPQILLALANSQSMDGNLSGAIMTGSGSIPHPLLFASSSPVNFAIPSGFTPPVNPGSGGFAPYTVNSGGLLLDNSASRLNVAKAGLISVLNAYMADADFGLMQYDTGGNGAYTTWVYQMSQPGGFTFTNTIPPVIPANTEYVANPCYLVNITSGFQVANDCANLNSFYSSQNIHDQQYMVLGQSSDDPAINDVLYAGGGIDPLCMVYGGPSPISPFPPAPGSYPLSSYNNNINGVVESYGAQVNSCAGETGPTNAGFVPFSTQVMYEERGFGFYTGSENGNGAQVPVGMTSAGATPTAASVAAAILPFLTLLAPETNSTGTPEIKALATQSPMAGLMVQAASVFAGNPVTTNGCTTQRYVVLVTDGLPTMDRAGHSWPPLGSTAASPNPNGWNVIANFNPDGSFVMPAMPYGTNDDRALIDVINQLTALNSGPNPIKTYIVGVGAGVDPLASPQAAVAAQTLTAMAIAGGTGNFFPATSPSEVTNDLQIIITAILAQTQSTASAAVNSTGLNVNSKVYQSQFVTSDSPYQDWTGNLFQYGIVASSGVVDTTCTLTPVVCWSAQTQLDAQLSVTAPVGPGPSSRIIATWDPTQNKAIPFEWTTGTPVHGIATSTTLGTQLQSFTPDTNGQDVLQYLRGSAAKAIGANATTPVGPFRNRSHFLGDIIDSNPAYIGPSSEGIQSASYITFAASTASRPPLLYIGANDGMLHAFDVNTGDEKFAYIPQGGYSHLVNLVSPFYNAQHRFFVNGSPQGGDVQFTDTTWHSILVGTQAQGGNSVYALDVTDPTMLTTEVSLSSAVLWDFTDTDMGLGFASPVIAATAAGWKVFIANGYNSTNQKPILYALDPQTGPGSPPSFANMIKIDLCAAVPTACNTSIANGLSSPIAVNSGGQVAGGANLVYAGDLQGNMWRIDVSNSDPTQWAMSVSLLYQARDGSGNMQPITTKPVATLNPNFPQTLGTMVLFGTGQFLGVPDISNESVQSIYGIYDPPGGYTTPPTRTTGIVLQTLSTATIGTEQVRTVTTNPVSIPASKGWAIDLNVALCATPTCGERVINDPRLETGGELVLTTYTPVPPTTGSCTTGGSSYLMVLNFATGSSFTTPQFDVNGDGFINSSDTVVPTAAPPASQPVAPVGMSLGSVYASAPTIRSGSFANGTGIALITESAVGVPPGGPTPPGGTVPTIQPVILKGSSKSRTAWWEIRQ
jgi:type IV pilus assembly protein PilY1